MPPSPSDPTASRATRRTIALRCSGTQAAIRHNTALLRAASELDGLREAACAGDAVAQAEFGRRHLTGDGVGKNKRDGLRWCRMAAEQGNAVGQFLLGGCYYNGEGVLPDPLRAYLWFSLAADQGVKEAATIRKLMMPRLSGVQLMEAKRMLREWRPRRTA